MSNELENMNEQPAQISGETARTDNEQPISATQKEAKHETAQPGRNPDGTFANGNTIGHTANLAGRPRGIGFKALLRHIADEIAEGMRTRREVLIDDAFAMARWQPSGAVLIKMLDILDDEPQQVEIIRRRLELRSTKPAPPVGVNRFAEQNGNGNGHAGTNGNGHA